MHNRFESLLRRCKARKRKILMKRIALLSLFGVLAGAAIYLTGHEGTLFDAGEKRETLKESTPQVVQNRPEPAAPKAVPAAKVEKIAAASAEEPKVLIPEPKKVQKRPEKSEKSGTDSVKPAKQVTKKEATKAVVREKRDSRKDKEVILFKPEERKSGAGKRALLEIKEVTNIDALKEQYANSPRYSVALKIAEKYYDDGDFENASLWARKANLMNRDDERAWLIYAESEYALGREKRAERILRLFLDYKDSAKARSLLMTWSRK